MCMEDEKLIAVVCMRVCIYTYTCIVMCMYIYTRLHVCVCMFMCMLANVHGRWEGRWHKAHSCGMYACVLHVCVCILYIYVHGILMYICIHTYTNIHTQVASEPRTLSIHHMTQHVKCIYVHTHIHTHTHTHTHRLHQSHLRCPFSTSTMCLST